MKSSCKNVGCVYAAVGLTRVGIYSHRTSSRKHLLHNSQKKTPEVPINLYKNAPLGGLSNPFKFLVSANVNTPKNVLGSRINRIKIYTNCFMKEKGRTDPRNMT